MGKRTPIRPAWADNLGTLIASGERVRASCDTCRKWKDVDLVALAAHRGEAFDLWGKRTRCRITPGCKGRVLFLVSGRGKFSPMKDE